MKTIKVVIVFFVLLILSGCAEVTVLRAPTVDLSRRGKMYVVHFSPDKRHLERIIARELSIRGYLATYGEQQNISEDTDIIVEYIDHWFWDIVNYMLDITIDFKDAKTEILIASGRSYRPSLQRKSPEYMIKETLDKLLAE